MSAVDLFRTVRGRIGPSVARFAAGGGDPAPPPIRPWPGGLRWTGVGRWSREAVMQWLDLVTGLLAGWSAGAEFAGAGRGTATAVVAGVVIGVPMLFRGRYPLAACCWSGAMLAWSSTQHVDVTKFLPAAYVVCFCCLYSVAVRCSRGVTVAAGAGAVGIAVAIDGFGNLATNAFFICAVLLLGYNVRQRRLAQLEIVRQLEQRSSLEERQRLARELHDVVAHHMAGIAIQAEAAPYRVQDPPPELAESLAEIRALAVDGLSELRRVLGVLRTETGPETGPETAPQPGLDRYGELIASARAGGLSVDVSVTVLPLPAATGLSAYRILQEALSNVMKHAPGARVLVRTDYGPGTLTLTVRNDPVDAVPAATAALSTGHGLIGMRERAAMLGGHVLAGPAADGGFAVVATLPLKDGP